MAAHDEPSTSALRLSNSDRDAAVAALAQAQAEGRITADEFGERSAAAQRAVTRGDLAPLFADLPMTAEPGGATDEMTATGRSVPGQLSTDKVPEPAVIPPQSLAGVPPQVSRPSAGVARRRPLGGSGGVVIVSVMPFVALGLFFLFGYTIPDGFRWSWLFFALIPIAGIIVYGGGGRRGYERE
jgi:hypothetical protein